MQLHVIVICDASIDAQLLRCIDGTRLRDIGQANHGGLCTVYTVTDCRLNGLLQTHRVWLTRVARNTDEACTTREQFYRRIFIVQNMRINVTIDGTPWRAKGTQRLCVGCGSRRDKKDSALFFK